MYRTIFTPILLFAIHVIASAQGQIPTLNLGSDTSYCSNIPILLTSNLIDSSYNYLWNTGDTTETVEIDTSGEYWLKITYDTTLEIQTDTGLTMRDTTLKLVDTINITINMAPIPIFLTDSNCFGTPSLIINNSMFIMGSVITYIIKEDTLISTADTVPYSMLLNGESVMTFTMIDQPNGCSATDTFEFRSMLKPNILFQVDSTCENVAPLIENHSSETYSSYTVSISETSTWLFSQMNSFELPIQAEGTHTYNCILVNSNWCSDTILLPLYVFDILPRDILGLDPTYCIGAPPDHIQGNFSGGIFSGLPYITNFSPGQAQFNPFAVDSNIAVTYTYTDSNNCTLDTIKYVENIYPLPILSIEGLESQYCQFDPASIISTLPPGGILIGDELSEISENGAVFSPNMVGLNNFVYTYTDMHGCLNSTNQITSVNPLPDVEFGDSLILITSGDSLILGPEMVEANILYYWSTGQNGNTIEITNPGYYILYGQHSISGCTSSDTIQVELINKINTENISSGLKFYPIPFVSELFIEGLASIESIRVYDLLGRPVFFDYQSLGSSFKLTFDPKSASLLLLVINEDISVQILKGERN